MEACRTPGEPWVLSPCWKPREAGSYVSEGISGSQRMNGLVTETEIKQMRGRSGLLAEGAVSIQSRFPHHGNTPHANTRRQTPCGQLLKPESLPIQVIHSCSKWAFETNSQSEGHRNSTIALGDLSILAGWMCEHFSWFKSLVLRSVANNCLKCPQPSWGKAQCGLI